MTLLAFATFQSIMAAFVHHRAERSVFALQAATLLMLALFLWTPLHTEIFSIPDRAYMRRTVWGLKCLSFLLFLASTFEIDHFELFGIKQSFGMGYHIHFVERFFYRVVRHPMMLFLLATFWFQPYITYGTLLQATVLTLWVVLSVHFFEEPDIAHKIGEDIYADYTQRVPFRYVPGFCPMRLSRTTKKIA
jgi:protein-S-isoprenylcysteine O-methyltransferase Ste14